MPNIVVYQTNKSVGRGTTPYYNKLSEQTKTAIQRLLFIDVEYSMLDKLEELSAVNKNKLADVLIDSLDNNCYTYDMN